ncbi:MAG: shikimate kinase [Chloroflexota bacterium]
MKSNIALIGFMGVGKTEVGNRLAKKLRKRFVELDALIAERAGKQVSQIFAEDGEIFFRELEIQMTKEIALGKNQVIACGGGIVLNMINIDRLRRDGVTVLLTASPGVILRRVAGSEGRPLLNTPDRARRVRELLAFRKPFYERAADIRVNTSRLGIEQVIEKIIEELKRNESLHR